MDNQKKLSQEQLVQYRIPITGLKTSTNKIYAGAHWSKRKQIKDNVFSYATAFCRPIQKIGSYPIEIRYRFLFRKRPLDTTNTAYLAKMFEDSLVSLGIIENDSPKCVAKTILEVPFYVAEENEKGLRSQGTALGAQNQDDWLEITISPLK